MALTLVGALSAKTLIVGIDLTVTPRENPAIVNGASAYIRQHCTDGDSFVAIAITRRTLSQPIILAQGAFPSFPGIKAKARNAALASFVDDLSEALRRSYSSDLLTQSHIRDFFELADMVFQQRGVPRHASERVMAIFSDMLEVDSEVNWESSKVEADGLKLPALVGVVAIYGVQSHFYDNRRRWEEVRRAWIKILSDAGLEVTTYSRLLP